MSEKISLDSSEEKYIFSFIQSWNCEKDDISF